VNPRFKERRLVWRAGDVLLVAIDPEIRTGSMMHRANAIAQYKNQEAAKKTFELTFVTAAPQAPVESSKGSVSADAEPQLPLHRTTTLDQKPPVEGDRGKTTPKTTPRTSADDVNTPRSSHESAAGKTPGPRVRPKSPAKKKGSGSKGNSEEGSKF
jgi:hypothetical protein